MDISVPVYDRSRQKPTIKKDPDVWNGIHNFMRRQWIRCRPLIARHRRNPMLRGVASLSHWWLKAYENCNGDFATNGEEMVLRSLSKVPMTTVFDVGANKGHWSMLANRLLSGTRIYSFELSPPTFIELEQNLRGTTAIRTFNFGLSDHEGETTFYHYPDKPGETSLMAHTFQGEGVKLKGQLQRGDAFCATQGIDKIDFLKIDVEGAESLVLRGFQKMLDGGCVSVIQFEYEKLNAITKFLLTDLYALLSNHGYIIGKIFPSYVDFRAYRFEQELLWGSNYLAVAKSRRDLLELLPK